MTIPRNLSDLANQVDSNGTLAVGGGGTGITSGTSGGVPYYSAASTIASSAALAANALVIGGGAGAAPATTTTGTGVVTALGVNTGTAGAFVVNGGALGTPSSGTVTNLTGTASININGTVGATTANTGAFTSITSTSASGITQIQAATQDGVKILGRAGGTSSYTVTLTPTTLASSTTLTLPNVTDTVAVLGTAQTFTAAQTFRAASSVRAEAAATQDAMILAGRAGGTSSYAVTLTPTTLTASRTVTFPDAATSIPIATQTITFSGPTAARTYTFPDAATTIVGTTDTQTLTNKRVTPRVSTTTSSATPTINTDNVDMYGLTAQAVDITSFTTNLSGTPTDGQKLWIYIVGTAARAITWGASFESSTVTLPTTTVTTNRLDVGFVWNAATSKWRCVATS